MLGGITLPRPKSLQREIIEVATENITILGRTTKKILHRKERFVLSFTHIKQTTVSTILSEYTLNAVRTFLVTEANLSIGPTDVLIDMSERQYIPGGTEYIENFKLVLTEVT